jgi:hypothetical protein
MKNNNYLMISTLFIISFIFTNTVKAHQSSIADSITDKVICGYQGWFSCYGDGSPLARWFHWSFGQYQSNNGKPSPGYLTFDVYPDVSGYKPSSLFQTGFANQGDGKPAKLFSSYLPDVIDTHFCQMQKNGIDGIALQRFIGEVDDPLFKLNRDSISVRIKRSAEKYNRIFYLMYCGFHENEFDSVKNDWQNNMIGKLHLTSSPMYAKQDSKPVVCIWGFGLVGEPGDATQCLDLINWFKSQGCYVIGGVPNNWRTCTGDSKAGFENVYKAFDMISPWTVGRYSNSIGIDIFKTDYLIPDMNYCHTYGIKYQPVIFPGSSWSNWHTGPQNEIPRNKGKFMWQQVYNLQQLGIKNMYVAMFDEYDEGTAILNMADSYYMIPTDQYFVTSSADGTYISSDFYLRLVGKATKVIRGIDPVTENVPIPYSNGPIYFRTSLEKKYDAQPDWISSPDPSSTITNVIGYGGTGAPSLSVIKENGQIGDYALKFKGRDTSTINSYCYFRAFDVDIPVYSNTNLSFWNYPSDSLARYISVDLVMTDGSNLRDAGAIDINGISMHPGAGRGTINTWTQTNCNIGKWLNGKTIDRIMVAYSQNARIGDFTAYIDDISIYTGVLNTSVINSEASTDVPIRIYPNPVTNGIITIDFNGVPEESDFLVCIYDVQGRIQIQKLTRSDHKIELSVQGLQRGIHLITIQGRNFIINKKLIIL